MKKAMFGVIVGNRGFFPRELGKEARKKIVGALRRNGFKSVPLSMEDTRPGRLDTSEGVNSGIGSLDEYHSWQDSRLAEKIVEGSVIERLNRISEKAAAGYPRATWGGWVDHSKKHVLSVLRNLDRITPGYVRDTMSEQEAFVLIAAVLLHDIGMIAEENASADLQYFVRLRVKHGERGEEIIRRDFSDFLKPFEDVLNPVCEIVKNHHGKFEPQEMIGLPYDLRADALWVRLADEIDFGPHRAPTWLLERLKPDKDGLEHWIRHNELLEPAINLELFRIQIMGTVEDSSFIQKLKPEFEAPQRQDIQRNFLSRGLKRQIPDNTFIILDCTRPSNSRRSRRPFSRK